MYELGSQTIYTHEVMENLWLPHTYEKLVSEFNHTFCLDGNV